MTSKKIWEMTKQLATWMVAQRYSATLGHQSLAYRPRISNSFFCEAGYLKDCPALSCQGFVVTFFCVLFVQFEQHTVSSWGNGTFLPSAYFCHKESKLCVAFLLCSRLVLPGADMSHCLKKESMLLKYLKCSILYLWNV